MGRLTSFARATGSAAPIERIPPEIFKMILDNLKEAGNHTDHLVLRMTSPACYLMTPALPVLETKAWDSLHDEFEGRVVKKKLRSLLCWKCHKLLGNLPQDEALITKHGPRDLRLPKTKVANCSILDRTNTIHGCPAA